MGGKVTGERSNEGKGEAEEGHRWSEICTNSGKVIGSLHLRSGGKQ